MQQIIYEVSLFIQLKILQYADKPLFVEQYQ